MKSKTSLYWVLYKLGAARLLFCKLLTVCCDAMQVFFPSSASMLLISLILLIHP